MKSNMKSGGQEPKKVQGVMEAESDELRLVLVGKTGGGKSASGNTILGGKHFLSRVSSSSVTQVCELGSATIQGRRVTVVDLPGFGDTHLSAEQVHEEVARCVCVSAPGPHAFLLVVPIGRYTEDEDRAVSEMTRIFGKAAVPRHTVLLFTRGDDLEGSGMEEYLSTASPGLRALIDRCGGRYHVFNNKEPGNSAQVGELLLKVEAMVEENGLYTNDMLQEAAASIWEEVERRIRDAIPDVFKRVWREMRSKITPELLKRVKIMVASVATGVAAGAFICVAALFALAGCTAVATGTVVAVLTGGTAVTLGAVVGGVMGGAVGVSVGTKADSPEEGAKETVKKIVEIGATAVNTMKESCYRPLSKQRQE